MYIYIILSTQNVHPQTGKMNNLNVIHIKNIAGFDLYPGHFVFDIYIIQILYVYIHYIYSQHGILYENL